MNLNRSMLVAVAVSMSARSALGCKSRDNTTAETTPVVAAAAEAPVAEAPAAETASTDEGVNVAAKIQIAAPPAARVENPGRAPSARHTWNAGF